jgi:hypothetical protein
MVNAFLFYTQVKLKYLTLENINVKNQILQTRRYYYFDNVFTDNENVILLIYFKV